MCACLQLVRFPRPADIGGLRRPQALVGASSSSSCDADSSEGYYVFSSQFMPVQLKSQFKHLPQQTALKEGWPLTTAIGERGPTWVKGVWHTPFTCVGIRCIPLDANPGVMSTHINSNHLKLGGWLTSFGNVGCIGMHCGAMGLRGITHH